MIEEAVTLARTRGLRAYDAVQLAGALDTRRAVSKVESTELIMVSADVELNAAAAAEGFQVEDPNNH
jgi:predicted nucleic acid-binding protein